MTAVCAKSSHGEGYMAGTIKWHEPAKRFYFRVWWHGRDERFWMIGEALESRGKVVEFRKEEVNGRIRL